MSSIGWRIERAATSPTVETLPVGGGRVHDQRTVKRVFDLLARLSSHPSAPFDRLLGMILRVVRPGTTVVVLTARDPSGYLPWLRRIERAGCRVVVVACGPDGPADAGRVRQAGLVARSVRLDGPWRTAGALALTG